MRSWREDLTKSSRFLNLWNSWAFQALEQHSSLFAQIQCVNQGGHCSATCYLITQNIAPSVFQICLRYSLLWTIYPLEDFMSWSYRALNLLGVFSAGKLDISDNGFSSINFHNVEWAYSDVFTRLIFWLSNSYNSLY